MTYLGSNGAGLYFYNALSFKADNAYAYGAACEPGLKARIYGFERQSDGMLTYANINPTLPKAKNGDTYCPSHAAADPTDHVAFSFQPIKGYNVDEPAQLATYTSDKYGNLSTTSTSENMPKTAVGTVYDISMSPSGKLLAVGGASGLQIFHFNGGEPITAYTALLTTKDIRQIFWDNDNHLYAISSLGGQLMVFTVTPTKVSEAPGSPYPINYPVYFVVQPKTAVSAK